MLTTILVLNVNSRSSISIVIVHSPLRSGARNHRGCLRDHLPSSFVAVVEHHCCLHCPYLGLLRRGLFSVPYFSIHPPCWTGIQGGKCPGEIQLIDFGALLISSVQTRFAAWLPLQCKIVYCGSSTAYVCIPTNGDSTASPSHAPS